MTNFSKLSEQDRQHHLHPATNPVALGQTGPDMVVRAEGVYLYMADGRRILDIGAGLSNVHLGYGNRRLCDAAYATMKQLSYGQTLAGRSNPWAAALSEKLAEITPAQFQTFFFASTGSDAIESAAKIALRYWRLRDLPEKRVFISRHRSYHGNTLFATSLTSIGGGFHSQFGLPIGSTVHHAGSPHWHRHGEGLSEEAFTDRVIAALERQILEIGPAKIAAFVGDPVQMASRVVIPSKGYWLGVRALCDRYDILLIDDEVISGFGNTGRMFGFENFGYEPDLVVMAKGISSGYFPISSVGIGAKVAEVLTRADDVFAHVFTNCGHPVGASVALESIAIIQEERLVDRAREYIHPHVLKGLKQLLQFPCITEIRAIGAMGAFEVDLNKIGRSTTLDENDAFVTKIERIAWKRGLATHGPICCPLITTRDQIDEAVEILKESVKEALGNVD